MSEQEPRATEDTAQGPSAGQYPPPQGPPVESPAPHPAPEVPPTPAAAPSPPPPSSEPPATQVVPPPAPVAAPPPPPSWEPPPTQVVPPPTPASTPAPPPPQPAAQQPGYAQAPAPAPAAPPPQPTLLDRAKADDQEALRTMFAQFLPRGEEVLESHYLGVLGFWGIGTHSFAAVTPRRIATLRISLLGGVEYQDGSLEYVNSAAVYQPSKVMLYVTAGIVSLAFFLVGLSINELAGIVLLLLSLALLPLTVRFYYRFKKSGLVLWVREGLQVYAFIDRKRMRLANQLYRRSTDAREERLRNLGHP